MCEFEGGSCAVEDRQRENYKLALFSRLHQKHFKQETAFLLCCFTPSSYIIAIFLIQHTPQNYKTKKKREYEESLE